MNPPTNDYASRSSLYSTLTLSFLAGGLAGAAFALLIAPQSGRATRKGMRRKLTEATHAARVLTSRAQKNGRKIRDEAMHRLEAAAAALAATPGRPVRGNGDLGKDEDSA